MRNLKLISAGRAYPGKKKRARLGRTLFAVLVLTCAPAWSQKPAPPDLTQLGLDELFNLNVTTVSKKEQPLAKTAAAAFVITADDIRRSGATNIPDLLRMVPGVDVAQIDSNAWSIGMRGFSGLYSNKVLVLIDGRSVYNQVFSGVYWDQISVPLENIERIEVIRGPGGTVWGANAVNGVINIITKSARDTKGTLVRASGGNANQDELLQYGGDAGSRGSYRIYGEHVGVGNSTFGNGASAADGWRESRSGFRSDWNLSDSDTLMAEGNVFANRDGETLTTLLSNDLAAGARSFNDIEHAAGGDFLALWRHSFANGSEGSVQVYHDEFRRFEQANVSEHETDADLQYHFYLGSRQDVIVGAEFRNSHLAFRDGYSVQLTPPEFVGNLWSSFVQDEIRLTPSLALTIGSKFEHNSLTGFEMEPGAQLAWTPTATRTVWLSASQAIRQPAWVDESLQYNSTAFPLGNGAFGVVQVLGNPASRPERLRDYEAGYRTQLSPNVSLDVAAFLNLYHGLQTNEPGAPFFTPAPAPAHLVIPLIFANSAYARDWGGEVFVTWNATHSWRLSPGFSYLRMNIGLEPGSQSYSTLSVPGDSPRYQAEMRSSVSLPHRLEWDVSAYFVSALVNGPVPAYTRVDTRLGWRIGERTELSVTGQNLLSPGHYEFSSEYGVISTRARRSVIAKITWRF